jgi:hypothetical protein
MLFTKKILIKNKKQIFKILQKSKITNIKINLIKINQISYNKIKL